jgi:Helix-turn-helix domain
MAAGADGLRYEAYHGGDESEPDCHDISEADKQRVLRAFDRLRYWLWRNTRRKRGQAVSRVYREVLSSLLSLAIKYRDKGGGVYPTQQRIAQMACCSVRTVSNALNWLRLWGFLDWKQRIKRHTKRCAGAWDRGMRFAQQTSNAYQLEVTGLAKIGQHLFGPERTATTAIKKASRGSCREVCDLATPLFRKL